MQAGCQPFSLTPACAPECAGRNVSAHLPLGCATSAGCVRVGTASAGRIRPVVLREYLWVCLCPCSWRRGGSRKPRYRLRVAKPGACLLTDPPNEKASSLAGSSPAGTAALRKEGSLMPIGALEWRDYHIFRFVKQYPCSEAWFCPHAPASVEPTLTQPASSPSFLGCRRLRTPSV